MEMSASSGFLCVSVTSTLPLAEGYSVTLRCCRTDHPKETAKVCPLRDSDSQHPQLPRLRVSCARTMGAKLPTVQLVQRDARGLAD